MSSEGRLPEPQNAEPVETAEKQSSRAMLKALEILSSVIGPYMPLDRRPGRFVFEGVEVVVQSEDHKPFNNIGSIIMAARLLQRWEKSLGDDMKARIGRFPPGSLFITMLIMRKKPLSLRMLRLAPNRIQNVGLDPCMQPHNSSLTQPYLINL